MTYVMKQIKAVDPRLLLFCMLLALPLFYVIDQPLVSRAIRFSVLLLASLLVVSTSMRHQLVQNWRGLPKLARYTVIGMTAMMVLSTVRSADTVEVRLFGLTPEYLGLLTWASFLAVAIGLTDIAQKAVRSKITLLVMLVCMLGSLYINQFYIRYGFRVSGLLLQATSMGMFACLAYAIGLKSISVHRHFLWKSMSGALACVAAATVVLTQSRVSYFVLAVLSAGAVVVAWRRSKIVVGIALVALLAVSVLPRIETNYFDRFGASSVNRGVSYRLSLYKTSGLDIVKHNSVVGNGANSLPPAINNQNEVPEDIKKSLQTGELFMSTHSLYFDVAYYFGLVSSVSLLVLTIIAAHRYVRSRGYFMLALFGILIANALCNTPSLELTLPYFMVLFAAFWPTKLADRHASKAT